MKKLIVIIISLFILKPIIAQDVGAKRSIFRLNFINPGIEYEYSVSNKSNISANIGYGLLASYPNTTAVQPQNAPLFAPFFDLHYKIIYNFDKRKSKNKTIDYNAGVFFGIKFIGRGKNIDNGLIRTDDFDFAIGPTWGIRRNFKKNSILFNIGPQYYFDTKGNNGFYPIMFELNIGYILAM